MRPVIVGSRTTVERGARGRGLTVFDAEATPWRLLGEVECVNPSFVVAAAEPGRCYVVHGDRSEASVVELDAAGVPLIVQTVETAGSNPVHLALSASGRWLLVVNHSGSIVSLPVGTDGRLGAVTGRVDLTGTPGPHATDQGRPRPHQIVGLPGGVRFLVPDKGLDRVFTLALDDADGSLVVTHETPLRQLAGPRHLALHPRLPVAYTIDELASTVTVLTVDADGATRPVQVHSSLSPDDVRDSRGAEVVVSADGAWVFASNRSGAGDKAPAGPGDDTVVCFRVQPDGRLADPSWVTTGGQRPRFATWHADALYVAHEVSDTIVRLPADPGGRLGAPEVVAETGSPVCVVFA